VLVRWDTGPPQENRFFSPQLPYLGAGKETIRGSPLDFRAQSKVTLKLYQVYPAPLASLLPTRPSSKPQSNLNACWGGDDRGRWETLRATVRMRDKWR